MTVQDILKLPGITPVHLEADREIENVFCCDLLSVAMARAPESCAWVTVIGNHNAVAVATLADASCIVLAEGYEFDEAAIEAARGRLTLLKSSRPIFETARDIGAGS
ncbi:MAG: hypothetical protein IJC35_08620 [Oscillospiraceae bacterium]|nr:hypothetical protein [Oscillospiraceae bacterium]